MIVVLATAAAVALAGAIAALTARDARVALGGLGALLVATGFLDDPLPAPLAIGARVVGALLALELVALALRVGADTGVGRRSRRPDARLIGLTGLAAFVSGAVATGASSAVGAALPELAPLVLGTAFALVAIGLMPLVLAREPLAIGTGALVVLAGALVGHAATTPASTGLSVLAATAALVAAAGSLAGAVAAAAERERGERMTMVERPPLPIPKPRPAVPRFFAQSPETASADRPSSDQTIGSDAPAGAAPASAGETLAGGETEAGRGTDAPGRGDAWPDGEVDLGIARPSSPLPNLPRPKANPAKPRIRKQP